MTYSIVARDAETGQLGCAVQSQAFNSGAGVPWVRAGVGAIATQAFGDRRYGYSGLELLAAGKSPREALDELLAPDDLAAFRQVAFLDASGTSAQWTGASCIRCAGQVAGDGWAAQGNMLAAEAWHAMGAAFEATTGSLAQRLMAALDAAEMAGGDFRGRGGAGIVVVPATGEPWERVIDLRVAEGDDSLFELRRLLNRVDGDRTSLSDAHLLWLELSDAADAGDVSEGRRLLAQLETIHPHYRDFAQTVLLLPDPPPALRDIVGE